MMNMLATRTKLSTIGLDIDAHEFRAVQLIRSAKGISVLAWAIFPRQFEFAQEDRSGLPGVDELEWAKGILGRRGFVGETISIAISNDQCSSHVMELPPAQSGAPIDQLAKMEVARAKKCSPEEFEIAQWSLPAKGRTQETLAVACPRSVINDTIERYTQSGLTPGGIDLLELAICRASPAVSVENEINASLHIGWESSLAVITLGETVIYVRHIERGARTVSDVAKGRYHLSDQGAGAIINDHWLADGAKEYAKIKKAAWTGFAAELATELDVTIAYVSHSFRTAPLGKIRLSGYGSINPVIDEQLDKVLGIPIECAAPSELVGAIGRGQDAWSLACRLSVAFGLSARFDR
jgi:type IV pilus assembly protein PilM